ncbi:Holliday junction resolvase RuvX [Flexivirga sp. ID2601S]|uniref:Putative pre-16S rRNA nuclease n=2 Tax=Flexivirga aerilata TaxID=1656889 RepID=A0A849AX90_9MICO|nr:Holliday junction resolvase RuvX [Flexivirga aerilata]NNG41272.1 Holliday junction resolvase RuvX [Flexivirga aerilata]
MRRGVRLGVDVGSVRVGVASCDPDGLIATPLETVPRVKDGSDVSRVAELAAEHHAIEVIVGLPRSLDGAERAAAEGARAWAKALRRHTPALPVRLVDERMTTVDAHRALDATGVSHRDRRAIIDQQAAVLILQVALDSERVSGKLAGEAVGGRKPRRKPGSDREGRL